VTLTADAPPPADDPALWTDVLLFAEMMSELEPLAERVRQHEGRPYTEHVRAILAAHVAAIEFLTDWLPLPESDEPQVSADV
jgi:hypothetical protein